jgi:hypothetical protein
VSEVVRLIELLDLRLQCVVISPHYEDATDNGNAGQNGCQLRRKANQAKMDTNMKTMQEKIDTGQEK